MRRHTSQRLKVLTQTFLRSLILSDQETEETGLRLLFEDELGCGLRLAKTEVFKHYVAELLGDVRKQAQKALASYLRRTGRRVSAPSLLRRMKSLGLEPPTRAQLESFISSYRRAFDLAEAWQTHWDDDGVWGFRYLTMDDERVRVSHRPLHGITLPKDDPFWLTYWPPNGFGCRCKVKVLRKAVSIVNPYGTMPDPDLGFAENFGELLSV